MFAIIIIALLCFVSITQAGFEASAIRNTNVATTVDLSSTATGNETIGKFSIYDNPSLGIKFLYPPLWLKVTQLFGNSVAIIQFISPPDNQSKLRAVVSISAEKLSNTTSLEEYVKSNDAILKASANGYNVIESQNTTLAGNPAIMKVFTMNSAFPDKDLNSRQVGLKIIQMYGIKGNKAYVISLLAEESKYNDFLPVFQKIANSFQVNSQTFTFKPLSEITKDKRHSNLSYSYISYPPNEVQARSRDNSEQVFDSAHMINVQLSGQPGKLINTNHVERIAGALSVAAGALLAILTLPAGFIIYGAIAVAFFGGECWALCAWVLPVWYPHIFASVACSNNAEKTGGFAGFMGALSGVLNKATCTVSNLG